MARLRVVKPDDPTTEIGMGEAIDAAVAKCKAENPGVVMISWESPDGILRALCVPESRALRRGLVDSLFEQEHPQEAGAE